MDLLGNIEAKSGKNDQPWPQTGYNEAFHDLFDLFVGAGKRFSIKEIARATGISCDTISNWSQGISAPQFDNLMILCRVMPFEFKSRFIAMLGGNDIVPQTLKQIGDAAIEFGERIKKGQI